MISYRMYKAFSGPLRKVYAQRNKRKFEGAVTYEKSTRITEGCMSYIFPIFDKEKAHMSCLFGGATAPWRDENGKDIQKQLVMKFMKAAKENHCDVALANHTAFDAGIEKISYSKARLSYLPNIYVLGEEGVQKFCEVYITVAQ